MKTSRWPREAWIPLAARLLWLWHAPTHGMVGFLFSVIPGCLLVGSGISMLLMPGDRRISQFAALGGALGVVLALPAFFETMMRFHECFFDANFRQHHEHICICGGNLAKPGCLKGHADGEIHIGLCQGNHLPGFRLVGCWARTRLNHYVNLNKVAADLVH